MWSLRWHFTNKSVAGAPYSIKGYRYSLSHSQTLWWRVRWLKQCRLKAINRWYGKSKEVNTSFIFIGSTENSRYWCIIWFLASLCSASSLGCQHDTARIHCWTPCCGAVAAGHRRPSLSIDVFCTHSAQQQIRRTTLLCRWDRQTDGRTDARPLHRPSP